MKILIIQSTMHYKKKQIYAIMPDENDFFYILWFEMKFLFLCLFLGQLD